MTSSQTTFSGLRESIVTFLRELKFAARTLTRAKGLNRNTVGVYLTRTPILKTLGRGRYVLRGHALGAT